MVLQKWDVLRDRIEGCWWGQMVGDALGSQVEFDSAEALKRRWPYGLRVIGPSAIWGTAAGQVTDDSEMAIELLHALTTHDDSVDWDLVAAGYVQWYQSGPFDSGRTVRRAVRGANRVDQTMSGLADSMRQNANPDSKANGALMRQSPIGIWGFAKDPKILGDLAREDARLTHPNPVCRDASAVYTATIAQTIRWGFGPKEAYQFAREYHAQYGQESDVLECLDAARDQSPPFSPHIGYVLLALHNAFYQLLHTETFEEAVVSTVMVGGDTDTNGAIAGAMAGAVYGKANIPQEWAKTLEICDFKKGHVVRPSRYLPMAAVDQLNRLMPQLEQQYLTL